MNNNGDFELKIGDIKDELDEVKIEISPRKFKKILEEIKEIAEENPSLTAIDILNMVEAAVLKIDKKYEDRMQYSYIKYGIPNEMIERNLETDSIHEIANWEKELEKSNREKHSR